MWATLSIQACIRQPEPLNRTSMHQMFADDLLDILHMNEPIPDRVRIDHNHRPMLALIKTPQLIRTNLPLQTSLFHRIFER
jgi:hypothetical protein